MRKLNRWAPWLLALGFVLTGCRLAQPGAPDQPQPVGIWLEIGRKGELPAADAARAVDFDAPGAMGLILEEKEAGPDGEQRQVFGRTMTGQFLDVNYGSHLTVAGETTTERESSFSGTLYLSLNGDAPEALWLWRVYQGADGKPFVRGRPEEIPVSHMQLEQGGTYSKSFAFETTAGLTGGGQRSVKQAYTLGFVGIGALARVRIVELDKDFQRLSSVELELQDGDEYRTRPDTAYVTLAETYVAKGKETMACATYSVSDATDYDGEQALYHTLKYMGPDGIVLPRAVKVVFTGR